MDLTKGLEGTDAGNKCILKSEVVIQCFGKVPAKGAYFAHLIINTTHTFTGYQSIFLVRHLAITELPDSATQWLGGS